MQEPNYGREPSPDGHAGTELRERASPQTESMGNEDRNAGAKLRERTSPQMETKTGMQEPNYGREPTLKMAHQDARANPEYAGAYPQNAIAHPQNAGAQLCEETKAARC